MSVKPIPEGYHSVTPYLLVNGAAAAIDYYRKAFGATELYRLEMPGGKIAHAEIKIGNSPIMLADEFPDMGYLGPRSIGGTTVTMLVYVADVDTAFKKAADTGGKILRPIADQFYGDRSGTLEDPFGHIWTVATHKEDVPMEEIQKRAAGMQG